MAARARRPSPVRIVALAAALAQLMKFGALKKSPLLDAVAATSVGIVGGEPMLDLDYEEDSRADVDMNIVMTGSGKFVEVQATAEHRPFDDAQLTGLDRSRARRHSSN